MAVIVNEEEQFPNEIGNLETVPFSRRAMMTRDSGPMVVLHLPHSSAVVPDEARASILLGNKDLARELSMMTDHFTDELFAGPPGETVAVRFPVSRLVVDAERFVDDKHELMAKRGMGVIYERTSDGKKLRDAPSPTEREALINRYYRPHHRALEAAIERSLQANGCCLLLDCHSFPSEPIPCDLDPDADRRDFCLGTNQTNTPGWLVDAASSFLSSRGFSVAVNRPYAGVLVPERFSVPDSGVHALMIEVNRRLYMDQATCMKSCGFAETAAAIQWLVRRLVDETRKRHS